LFACHVSGAGPLLLDVMQRLKLLPIGTVFLASVVGLVALGLYSGAGSVKVEILRDQQYGTDRRIVVFKVRGWNVEPYGTNNLVQVHLKARWSESAELFGEGGQVACIVPAQAYRCKLQMRAQRDSPSERASALFERCGLMKFLPKVCDWVTSRLPKNRPPVGDVTVETSLPRIAHNAAAAVNAPTTFSCFDECRWGRVTDQRC